MTAQELKNSILQLAIQGKLVKQDPNDEPASVLLEEIKEEREKLIKEKKIKREKYSEIYKDSSDNHYYEKFEDGTINDITEEIPFDIPSSWCWTKLKNIGTYKKGPFGSALTKSIFVPKGENTIKVYEQKNAIYKDVNLGDYYISLDYFENKMRGFEIFPQDIIVSCAGTIGETYIIPDKFERGIINQALMKMRISTHIYPAYFLVYFDYVLKKYSIDKSKGSAIKNIPPFKIFKEYFFPIPPINEQREIVEKIEKINPLITNYETSSNELNTLNSSYKVELKKSILQYAIQGKLVSQNPDDESADILIQNILNEKRKLIKEKQIKKENLSVIYKGDTDNQFYEKFDDGTIINITDEIPFEIPDNWCWTRIKNLSSIVSKGTTPKGGKNAYLSRGINFFRAENVKASGKVSLENVMYIDEDTHQNFLKRSILEDKDILICIAGTLGRCAVITNEELPANTNQAVCFIRLINKNDLLINFILNALSSFEIQKSLLSQTKVTAIPNLTLEIISNCLIPIPPINEQKNIVDKLEKVFNIIG